MNEWCAFPSKVVMPLMTCACNLERRIEFNMGRKTGRWKNSCVDTLPNMIHDAMTTARTSHSML